LLLLEDCEFSGDNERLTNLPSLGSLVGRSRQRCPVISDETTIHFVTAVVRLLIEIGRLHRGLITKVRHVMSSLCN